MGWELIAILSIYEHQKPKTSTKTNENDQVLIFHHHFLAPTKTHFISCMNMKINLDPNHSKTLGLIEEIVMSI